MDDIYSSTIIEDVKSDCYVDPSVTLAYFYFDCNDVAKQQHRSLLCSLIMQLSYSCMSLPPSLNQLYSQNRNGAQQPTQADLMLTLKEMLGQLKHTYIILDALDECAGSEQTQLLDLIAGLVNWNCSNLHLLVTSRMEWGIEVCLKPLAPDQVNLDAAMVDQDIQIYLHGILRSDRLLGKWGYEGRMLIEESLTAHANGM